MSEETLQAIHDAIQAHFAERNDGDGVVTDWFVGYGGMVSNSDAADGISHPYGYCTSRSSPFGAYGVANLAFIQMTEDLSPDYE